MTSQINIIWKAQEEFFTPKNENKITDKNSKKSEGTFTEYFYIFSGYYLEKIP